MEEKDRLEIHFIQLVSSLYSSCMFQLGKIMNPITGKVERDLAGARATIELLRMLEAKTQGNLSAKEKGAITDALANMQMNYVDEVKKEQEKKPEAEIKAEEEKKTEVKESEDKKSTDGKNLKGRIIIP